MQTIVSGCAMYFVWMWVNIMIRNLQFFRHVQVVIVHLQTLTLCTPNWFVHHHLLTQKSV